MGDRKGEEASVRFAVREEVGCLNLGTGSQNKLKCQTCSRKHNQGFDCPGKEYNKCFDCGESRHFKGAPSCKKPKEKKTKKNSKDSAKDKKTKSWRVQNKESKDENTDDTDDTLMDSA